ncbi:protein-L-isoaspartate O-methyltransferase family protein [Streptomyces lydicus]|uniref:protein-L-isoaspartate O-methyltransferase family protein n=1 Tax=Streptomyces lydicus TaxID=47763 RepID=UPI0036ECF67D
MTITPTGLRPGRSELGRSLRASGALQPDWEETFHAIDRAGFLPHDVWPWDTVGKRSYHVNRLTDPRSWFAAADSDVPLVTQWDDGQHMGPGPGRRATSSSSAPSVVYGLLADLDLDGGMNLLDVGTGTGETAGALAHRAGPGRVTTLEVDPVVSRRAEQRLHALGLTPRVVVGDGGAGYLPESPYHRVLVTFGLHDIPQPLIQQTCRGGLIVAPWGTHYSRANAVVRLRVDGASATGRFTRAVEFMESRSQRRSALNPRDYVPPEGVASMEAATTAITEDEFGSGRFGSLPFILGLQVPACVQAAADKRGTSRPVWFYSLTDRSWACALFRDGKPTRVWQSGPRQLWDQVEAAYRWWTEQGRPGISRFGLSVTPEGQHAWLDDPGNCWPV